VDNVSATVVTDVPGRTRASWWIAGVAVTFAAWIFLHLPATDAAEQLLPRLGLAGYDHLWTMLALGMAALTGLYVAWREWSEPTPVWRVALALLFCVAISYRLLIVAPIEYVHYPQYALTAYLLARAGLPMESAFLIATALGAIDEAHQLAFLPRGTPDYYDWNDVFLNATGAAYGLVILYAGGTRRGHASLSWHAMFRTVVGAAVLALVLGRLELTPYLTETPRHTWFRVLSAFEAVVLLGLVWFCVRRLDRRRTA
jgi:hypothetical protein